MINWTNAPVAGSFDGVENRRIRGWVAVPEGHSAAVIQILVDAKFYRRVKADLFRPDLLAAGISNGGRAAFDVSLPPTAGRAPIEVIVEGPLFRALGSVEFPGASPVQGNLAILAMDRQIRLRIQKNSKRGEGSSPSHESMKLRVPGGGQHASHQQSEEVNLQLYRCHRPLAADLAAQLAQQEADEAAEKLKFRIFGHIDGHYSLSAINRGLAIGLDREPGSVVVNHFHGGQIEGELTQVDSSIYERISNLVQPWSQSRADDIERVSICHHYPLTVDIRPAQLRLCFFFWEESRVPTEHVEHINKNFDAVLVASQFVRKVLRDSGCFLSIQVVPVGVNLHEVAKDVKAGDNPRGRRFRFLHVSSAFPRKGVDILLRAFFEEFSAVDEVELFIKTFPNIHNTTAEQIRILQQQYRNGPVIHLDESHLTDRELGELYNSADAVVLPTRGEGFNLPAAEAMAYGIPVISTGYGGQWDFLTGETGWCIAFDFAHAETHVASRDSLWIEPSKAHLRMLLREFFETRGQRATERTVGGQNVAKTISAAKNLVRNYYTWENAGQAIRMYAQRVLNESVRPAKIRVGWISSWECRCGIAEYSKFISRAFNQESVILEYICDSRTRSGPGVRPLYVASPSEPMNEALAYVASAAFDAVVVQYQPSLFNLALALPKLVQIQVDAPVFLFMHSTRHFEERPPANEEIAYLRQLERIFVHTLDDVTTLRKHNVVENVVLFPHGVNATLQENGGPGDCRSTIRETLLELSRRTLSVGAVDKIAQDLRSEGFWIASFGFLLPHKGIGELVDAIRILHDGGNKHINLLLLCATLDDRSREQAAQIRKLIELHRLSSSVILVEEFLESEEINALLSAADLLVYAYQETFESASGAIRLGIASGRPILTTPLRIFEDVFEITFQTDDVSSQALARAIQHLAFDKAQLGRKDELRNTWVADRDWGLLADRLFRIMRGTLADRWLDGGSRMSLPAIAFPANLPVLQDRGLGPVPICAHGVIRPKTGVTRPWLSRTFHLGGTGLTCGPDSVELAWNSSLLSLTIGEGRDRGQALHLARSTRTRLSECVLHLDPEALVAVPPRECIALLDYTRRYQIRTVFWGKLQDAPKEMMFADIICVDTAKDRSDGDAEHASTRMDWCPIPPRLAHDLTPGGAVPETKSLRRLDVVLCNNDAVGRSALLRALQHVARDAIDITGGPVVRFVHSTAGQALWTILSMDGLTSEQIALFAERHASTRTALVMDESVIAAALSSENTPAWLSNARMLIFESSDTYISFFDAMCRRKVPIAQLRNRAVLLEDRGGPAGDLADRFARLLRVTHPIRATDVFTPYQSHDLVPFERQEKALTICISTYNRASWLRVTLPLLLAEAEKHLEDVEFLVVDNAATDETPEIMRKFVEAYPWVNYVRNKKNIGMLGNLAVSAQRSRGNYVWIVGDDDIIKAGTVKKILDAIRENPQNELIYINYAYTHFEKPEDLHDVDALISTATLIAPETPDLFCDRIADFAARNENFFTAIYACVFRRDHAVAAYSQYTAGPPFSDLATCIPTTKYVLEWMLDRPGTWIGTAQIVVNMNVSWMRYAPVWHYERLPEAYNLAEEMGVRSHELDRYRQSNLTQAVHFAQEGFSLSNGTRALLSMARYIENARGVEGFEQHVDVLLVRYQTEGQGEADIADHPPAGILRAIYQL
ncbi:MAG: hypothetical protein CTY25_08805 [Methylobacterium sp.]|nr:MAG: hypothetical protein CTY25_08805 [Methylobacterium sp.]